MKKAPESATFERQKGNFCNVKVELSQPESSTFRIRKSKNGFAKENILQKERQNFIFRMSNYFIFFLYILTFPTPVYLFKTYRSANPLKQLPHPYLFRPGNFPSKERQTTGEEGRTERFLL